MKIGIISDVHANAPALRTVLSELPSVDAIYHCGDIVGYNPYPGEVLDIFESENIISIQGNHDSIISNQSWIPSDPSDCSPEMRQRSILSITAHRAAEWTYNQLREDQLEFLKSLPREIYLKEHGIRLVHGAPGSQTKRLYPDDYSAALLNSDQILIHGHTHIQFQSSFPQGVVGNPGSVGFPRDGSPDAAYAILTIEGGQVALDFNRVPYPVSEVRAAIEEVRIPNQLATWLESGSVEGERVEN